MPCCLAVHRDVSTNALSVALMGMQVNPILDVVSPIQCLGLPAEGVALFKRRTTFGCADRAEATAINRRNRGQAR